MCSSSHSAFFSYFPWSPIRYSSYSDRHLRWWCFVYIISWNSYRWFGFWPWTVYDAKNECLWCTCSHWLWPIPASSCIINWCPTVHHPAMWPITCWYLVMGSNLSCIPWSCPPSCLWLSDYFFLSINCDPLQWIQISQWRSSCCLSAIIGIGEICWNILYRCNGNRSSTHWWYIGIHSEYAA